MMLNANQRLDLLRIALEISRSMQGASKAAIQSLDETTVDVFRKLRAELERGGALDDTNMSDVKDAIDVPSSLDDLID